MASNASARRPDGRMHALFNPESVAVIGASASPEKRGHQIVKALLEGGFEGQVLPVNPKGGSLLGLDVVSDLRQSPIVPDLAVIALPAANVPPAVEDLGRLGVPAVVVLAVGFGEAGSEGLALQQRLADVAKQTGTRVVGPNTSGLYNVHTGLNLIGTPGITAGPIGIVTQSGNLALHLMRSITKAGSGVSVCLGVGNQVDVGFSEALDYLADHDATRCVVLYVEGVPDGPKFVRSCARAALRLPVVVLKSARSAAGRQAALSHTGALAGPYEVLCRALVQVGVSVVEREDELTSVTTALAHQPPDPRGVVVLTDGGGQGTLACDRLETLGVPLAALSDGTRTRLRSLLGAAAAINNPVDLAGQADADPMKFAETLRILMTDPSAGSILVVGLFGGYHLRFSPSLEAAEREAAKAMASDATASRHGLVLHTMYAGSASEPLDTLRNSGVPVTGSIEVACAAVRALWGRGNFLALPPHPLAKSGAVTSQMHGPASSPKGAGDRIEALSEGESRETLAATEGLNVPFVHAIRCSHPDQVAEAARDFPLLVLKADVPGLAHKTELNGVELSVSSSDAASRATALLGRLEALGHSEPAVLVQPMLDPPLAELIVSIRAEPDVGVVCTVGAGGTWTEALADTEHVVLPCREGAVVEAMRGLRVSAQFTGTRGGAVASTRILDELEALAVRLGRFVQDSADIVEVELNPLFLYADAMVAADALVVVRRPES